MIVGYYRLPAGGPNYSFTYDHGVYTTIDIPADVVPQGINDAGEIVGYYYDQALSIYRSFLASPQSGYAPVAQDDLVSTSSDQTLSGNLLVDNGRGTDTDPDGDQISVVAADGLGTAVGHQITLASSALLTINPDGRFAYDPNGAFDGLELGQIATDSFTYTISDGQGHTSIATAIITIHGIERALQIEGASGTVTGTILDDQIAGGTGNEVINAQAGFDWVRGGDGNDELNGEDGSDVIDGGTGNDLLVGGGGFDLLTGGSGDDTIIGTEPLAESPVTTELDTALYFGNRLDYLFAYNSTETTITVSDERPGSPDGRDTLKGIAWLSFADNLVSWREIADQGPTGINLTTSAVAENSSIGTSIGTLSTIDNDLADFFTYSLLDSATGNFSLVGNDLIVNAALNYESASSHTVTVRVVDSTAIMFDKVLTIAIEDVNEAPTAIQVQTALTSTVENGPAMKIGNIIVSDDALGSNALSLAGPDALKFQILSGNGGPELWFVGNANFETQNTFSVTVVAQDHLLSEASVTTDLSLTISNVNEGPQSLVVSNIAAITENMASEAVIADLTVFDPDLPLAFNTYGFTTSDNRFGVTSGKLVLKPGQSIDFEQENSIYLLVTAVDTNDPTKTITAPATVQVNDANDNVPDITTLAALSTQENSSFVHALTSTDIDTVGTNPAVFSITGGADAALFDIVGSNLVFRAPRDFETQAHNYQVQVTASDGSNQASQMLTVNLTNVGGGSTGDGAANMLVGSSEEDVIRGLGGNDKLFGLGGNDVIVGGLGRDVMSGGVGRDRFDFNSTSEIGKDSTRDRVADFTHLVDRVDLSTIDAKTGVTGNQAFKFIGTAAFHDVKGELRYVKINNPGTVSDKTLIYGDVNGDGKADFQIELTGLKTLTAGDFIL